MPEMPGPAIVACAHGHGPAHERLAEEILLAAIPVPWRRSLRPLRNHCLRSPCNSSGAVGRARSPRRSLFLVSVGLPWKEPEGRLSAVVLGGEVAVPRCSPKGEWTCNPLKQGTIPEGDGA